LVRKSNRLGATRTSQGSESSGWRSLGHGKLLKAKLIPYLQECRERSGAAQMNADGGEPFTQAPNDVENQGRLRDGLAKVPKIVSFALELATVVVD